MKMIGRFASKYSLLGLVLAAVLTLLQAANIEAAGKESGDMSIESASLALQDGSTIPYETGTLYVPENRSDPKSRVIGVGFARFRALTQTTSPPTFHLPGGPGGSYLEFLQPGTSRFARMAKDIDLYRRVGDVVLIDQRGFSQRGEVLNYKFRTPEPDFTRPASLAQDTAGYVELARAAVADAVAKRIDLRGYTVKECAADVNDLRRALGYERITLVGQSFGSQWSFAVLRLYPQIVARAVLSGVEPLNDGYDMPAHVFAAIRRQWWEAEQDPRLQPWLPPGGFAAAAESVLHRLQQRSVSMPVSDRKTGNNTIVTLGLEDFQRDFGVLSRPNFLLALYYEYYEQWARHTLDTRRSQDIELPLIGPLIDSSLGVTPQREYLLRTDSATQFLGHWNFDAYLATAEIWPSADVGDEFRTEIINRIPVLFINGDWDVATPIENVLDVAPYFVNSRVLLVVHGFHNAYDTVRSELPETTAAIMKFLQTGDMTGLPAQVMVKAAPVALPNFPPPNQTGSLKQ